MSLQKFGPGYDWRGTKIEPGDTVIYGAGVGSHSIAMVEAEVVEVKGARVSLKIRYRAYGGSYKEKVSVGCDRVTVIAELPPAALKTAEEEIREREEARERSRRNEATHNLKPEPKAPERADFPLPTVSNKMLSWGGGGGVTTSGNIALNPTSGYTTATYAASNFRGYPRFETYDKGAFNKARREYMDLYEAWRKNPCTDCSAENHELGKAPCAGNPGVV